MFFGGTIQEGEVSIKKTRQANFFIAESVGLCREILSGLEFSLANN